MQDKEFAANTKQTKRISLFNSTVEWIENLVKSGKYPPGAKMPSEREMCEALGVSRTVLREALRAVESRGIITVYAGKGVYASQPNFDSLITPMELLLNSSTVSVSDLIQARHFLEPGIAHVAALSATWEDIMKLEENLHDMKEYIADGDKFIVADQQYHMNLALATKNPILYVMARTVVESLTMLRHTVYASKGAPARAIMRHTELIEALKAHDASKCFSIMEQHILDGENHEHMQLMQKSLDAFNLFTPKE